MPAPERGFSLVEALVALLIWMVAVLALSGVQARALLHARETELSSRIGDAAANLSSAILASPESLWPLYLEQGYDDHRAGGACAASCSAQQLADANLARFKRELGQAGRSEQARGVVCRGDSRVRPTLGKPGCDGKGELAIRVAWRTRLDGGWREHAGVWPLRP
ncbi:prepilin-type N-terminal cleavage/methylation domain-containing protein [Chromobacterium piscinae]|uniref:prepilin-type N-terminal cleavage/methylation domain-containing protein n=1 Tax=Chromobacterium piscinae TaxID=686831 RepID=UPI001E31B783|nr:prepilin-type N-terminal cleavage/methylation domain-containing protein [Chromobacterium piscinae]MCD5327600.1 prepilin-type N-terminal cleavage/methylation domain-containing protein [Chromobacterium piscinae]